jgi:hypothetical protein
VKVTVHVATLGEVAAAREGAMAALAEGDELEVIVGQRGPAAPAERQAPRKAVGYAPSGKA